MTTSLDMIRGRSNIVTLTNNSGGALVAGDVCVQDTSADEDVTTTTSAASVLKIFVAAESIAGGATGRFYESGYCPLVNVSASATRGYFLFTHTVAKQAATSATYAAGAFGKILKAGTSPSAIIYSATAQVVGGGTIGGSSGSTDNAVIRADGTGGATVQSSLATVDDSGGINIPTGQTYNINGSPHTHVGGGGASTSDHFIVGQGGEGDTDLSAKVIIPGLSGHPDIRVAATNDDEFDATNSGTLTGWTNLGTLDVLNTNTDFKSHLHIKRTESGSGILDGIYKAMTVPFTVTAKLSDLYIQTQTNYPHAGLFLAEASPGKIASFGIVYDGNTTFFIRTDEWTNNTTSTNPVHIASSNVVRPPIYLRMVVAASNSVTYAFSFGGFIYSLTNNRITYNPNIGTIGAAGIYVSGQNASVIADAAFDWIRFT